MRSLDKKITENLYRRGQSSFSFWSALSRFGFLVFLIVTIALSPERDGALIILSIQAIVFSLLMVLILQELTRRDRPHFLASPYKPFALRWSWPSGHAAMAFAWAGLFFVVSPLWGTIMLVLAALIAISRIFLGVHYFSDVLSGVLIGLAISGTLLML